MKKLFTLSIALLGGLAVQAQTLYPGSIPNLVARYTFSTTATTGTITAVPDVSGNGNNSGFVNNLTAGSDFRGMTNKAMLFNGVNSVIKVLDAPLLNPDTAITIVAVVNTHAYYGGLCQGTEIVSKGVDDHTSGNYYCRFTDNPSNDCFIFDSTEMQVVSAFGPTFYNATPTTYVPQNKWYFIATTYNGTEATVYQVPMDPQTKYESILPVATYPLTGTMGTNTNNLFIGMHNSVSHPYPFNGAMDELAIFNRGLTNSELYDIYSYLWGATLDVANNELLSDVSAYPNPAQNELNISGKFNGGNMAQLEVYNTMGQKVLAENITTNAGSIQHKVNTSNLTTGTYIAKLSAEGATKTIRFSVQR